MKTKYYSEGHMAATASISAKWALDIADKDTKETDKQDVKRKFLSVSTYFLYYEV